MNRVLLCAVLLLAALLVLAQTPEGGVLRMQFQNARTGEAVSPESISVNGRAFDKPDSTGGVMALPLPDGTHEIEIRAKGHIPLVTSVVVEGTNTLTNTFELEVEESEREKPNEVNAKTAVLAGYVVDSITGAVLPGVEVAIPDKQVVTKTDDKGRFTLSLSIPEGTREEPKTVSVSMVLSKDGYVTEQRDNLEVISGNQKESSYRMEPVEKDSDYTRKVVNEQEDERRSGELFTWVYDVSFD